MQMQRTVLHEAATNGNTGMVEFLMANFNTNLDAKDLVSWASVTSSLLLLPRAMWTVGMLTTLAKMLGHHETCPPHF